MTNQEQTKTLRTIKGTNYVYDQAKKVGQGYSGRIYKGIDRHNNSSVAIKVLKGMQPIQNQITFEELISLTSKCHHHIKQKKFRIPSIVEIQSVIKLDKIYIVMELCEYNLKQHLYTKKQPFAQQEIIKILKNVVKALLTIKQHDYHFCDLKPENILISKNGEAKLGDIQSLIKLNNENQHYHDSIFGTLQYMPPQLIQLGQYSSQNYIWTLGIMIHEMIYNSTPYKYQQKTNKKQNYSSFYKSLLDLNIRKDLIGKYPICHHLMENMLYFNEKKRISLEKVYQILHKQNKTIQQQLPSKVSKLKQLRSNSLLTADSQAILDKSDESDVSSRKISIQNLSLQQSQKYNQQGDQFLKSQIKKQVYLLELKNMITQKITPLVSETKSPLILAKKLQELNIILKECQLIIDNQIQTQKQQYIQQKLKEIEQNLKKSKAVIYLKKINKYVKTQQDKQLNNNEIKIWQMLKKLLLLLAEKQNYNRNRKCNIVIPEGQNIAINIKHPLTKSQMLEK